MCLQTAPQVRSTVQLLQQQPRRVNPADEQRQFFLPNFPSHSWGNLTMGDWSGSVPPEAENCSRCSNSSDCTEKEQSAMSQRGGNTEKKDEWIGQSWRSAGGGEVEADSDWWWWLPVDDLLTGCSSAAACGTFHQLPNNRQWTTAAAAAKVIKQLLNSTTIFSGQSTTIHTAIPETWLQIKGNDHHHHNERSLWPNSIEREKNATTISARR